jgi:maleylacetate reductase
MNTAVPTRSPEAHFGPGVSAQLPAALEQRGSKKVLLLTGSTRRFVERIEALLGPLELAVFDGARVHVPEDVVSAARDVVRAFAPDTIVSLGGGAATGLGKALKLECDLYFVAIPTTYSGSEMTSLYGITAQSTKRTGKDERVRPDIVLYDPAFTRGLPVRFAVPSLLNALAHPISVLSTGKPSGAARVHALDAARTLHGAIEALLREPGSEAAQLQALRGAARAGEVLDRGEPGQHHRLAHLLGGRLGLDHAGLHSVLLPHSLRAFERAQPALYHELRQALALDDLAAALSAQLERAGAPRSLAELGATREQVTALIANLPPEQARVLEAAFASPPNQ